MLFFTSHAPVSANAGCLGFQHQFELKNISIFYIISVNIQPYKLTVFTFHSLPCIFGWSKIAVTASVLFYISMMKGSSISYFRVKKVIGMF